MPKTDPNPYPELKRENAADTILHRVQQLKVDYEESKNKLTKISKLKSRILYDRQESELQILQCKIRYYKRYVVQQ